MAIVPEIHASRLLAKTVVDNRGEKVGQVVELFVRTDEALPPLVAIEVACKGRGGKHRIIAWSAIQVLVREYLSLTVPQEQAPSVDLSAAPFMPVKRTLFDKQIVDMNGLKVVRVNDVKFNEIGGELRLVAVDVGLRGLLRRLGLRFLVHWVESRFHRALPDTLIQWADVERIDTDDGAGQVKLGVPYERLAKLRPADLADIVEALNARQRSALLGALDQSVAAEALTEVEPEVRSRILAHLGSERASDLLESMPADEAADILSDLRPDQAEALLNAMEAGDAQEVRELLEYEEDTAGRLMSTEFIGLQGQWTAAQAIDELRRLQPKPDVAYYLYIIDEEKHLNGVLSLRDLIIAPPDRLLAEIMHRDVVAVHEEDGKDKVGEILAKYDLLALPVLDDEGRLVGVVSLSDAVDDIFAADRHKPRWWAQ